MQIKDIIPGNVYRVGNENAIVLAKGKYRTEYAQHHSHDLDFAGVFKQTLVQRWYVSNPDPSAKANSVVVWIPDWKRIDVVGSRQVQRLVHPEDVQQWLARQSIGEEQNRIHVEETERLERACEIVAFAIADVLGRDHAALTSWDKRNPWRMISENEEFVKKATLAYMKILAAKGEPIGGAPADELIEEIKSASAEIKQANTRRAARLSAAEAKAIQNVAALSLKVTVAPTPKQTPAQVPAHA